MKKVALVFVTAVFVPSLVLAWLAFRSLRDQQFLVERQQAASYQGLAGALAGQVNNALTERRREFNQQVQELIGDRQPRELAPQFDARLRQNWPLAEVGFVVSLQGDGQVLAPSLFAGPDARMFRLENDRFLCNKEAVEVYWNAAKGKQIDEVKGEFSKGGPEVTGAPDEKSKMDYSAKSVYATKSGKVPRSGGTKEGSKVSFEEAEFRHLIGDSSEGTLARFLQNKLKVLFWYRPPRDPQLVFGAQVNLLSLVKELEPVFQVDPNLADEIAVALVDDSGRALLSSKRPPRSDWKHPFVSAEIGEMLPHWEVAVNLLNPAKLTDSASTFRLTLGLLIGLLLLAIAVGSWLIVSDVQRQLTLSRQKTDFVSNVSHELKTPLTSIRMFSELLAEGRGEDRQREYLGIISAETARLTRLINNVLDFARMERGGNKYRSETCDLARLVQDTVESYRPQLQAAGFTVDCEIPDGSVEIKGDRDALAQVLLNLISNAEKYSAERKEITVWLTTETDNAIIQVLDRGVGVPPRCEEKIFEQFYRAHDSLSSGIQGSGLGLTLARQIARAHGGDIICQARAGGGSCFQFKLPLAANQTHSHTNESESKPGQ